LSITAEMPPLRVLLVAGEYGVTDAYVTEGNQGYDGTDLESQNMTLHSVRNSVISCPLPEPVSTITHLWIWIYVPSADREFTEQGHFIWYRIHHGHTRIGLVDKPFEG